jgi:hypothetical protein
VYDVKPLKLLLLPSSHPLLLLLLLLYSLPARPGARCEPGVLQRNV